MIHPNIIDSELVKLYNTDTPIKDIEAHFGVSRTTVFEHLRKAGGVSNRRGALVWTDMEEYQLIAAYIYNCTGQDLSDSVPTRSLNACKGHLVKLRRVKGGVVR